MVKGIIISRKSDGLIFCEVTENDDNDKNFCFIRSRAQDFLKTMQNKEQLCTVNIDSPNYVFHYKINENVVYLVIADKKYPPKNAFYFLNVIDEGFSLELKNHFGTQSVSYYSKLETIDRANYFIKFEKFIKKQRNELLSGTSQNNIDKLNKEISDVHQIMADSINHMMDRERTIKSINILSESIKDDSGKFKKLAYETRIKMLLSKYSVFIALFAIVLLIIIFKVYF